MCAKRPIARPGWIEPNELLTVREVASALRVKAVTVYKLCREGKLAHARFSNAIRVPEAAVARYLAGHRTPSSGHSSGTPRPCQGRRAKP